MVHNNYEIILKNFKARAKIYLILIVPRCQLLFSFDWYNQKFVGIFVCVPVMVLYIMKMPTVMCTVHFSLTFFFRHMPSEAGTQSLLLTSSTTTVRNRYNTIKGCSDLYKNNMHMTQYESSAPVCKMAKNHWAAETQLFTIIMWKWSLKTVPSLISHSNNAMNKYEVCNFTAHYLYT